MVLVLAGQFLAMRNLISFALVLGAHAAKTVDNLTSSLTSNRSPVSWSFLSKQENRNMKSLCLS